MKKYLMILLIGVLTYSCNVTQRESMPENPEQITTIEVLNNADTAVISIVNNNLFILDENNEVKYQTKFVKEGTNTLINSAWVFIIFILIFWAALSIAIISTKD